MNQPLQPLEDDLASLREVWVGALPTLPANGGDGDLSRDVSRMSDAGLVSATDALARLARDTEAVLARVSGELARRSPADLGKDGLAKRQGFQNPARMVAAATGGALGSAARMVQVGKATATRMSLTGEELPPAHPHVAEALSKGRISVDAASAVTTMLDRVKLRADSAQALAVEEILAARAADLPYDLLLRLIREAEARLDQDGVAPREEELRAERSLTIREDRDGMVRVKAVLDPETAAPIKAAVESLVTSTIRANRDGRDGSDSDPAGVGSDRAGSDSDSDSDRAGGDGGDARGVPGPVVADDRTVPQLQADALAMIARHVLGCSRMPSTPAATIVVRTDLETLTDGVGHGVIDGLTQPVSAGTIRKMAATAGLIPAVFGGESLPLDLGRDNRLFSRAQRLALGERDGGCACCGLDVSYTEAHHIDWWKRDRGPTDLDNGVLLCPPCHGRIHDDGWVIRVREGRVWFIPPPHVDIDRRPRLGGKARYALPTTNVA